MLVEIIATNLEEAIQIENFGGGRVELIHAFTDGGLSPDLKLAKAVADSVSIPVNVMVRPHARSFCYDSSDWKIIEAEIDYLLSNTNINGIVFGSLNNQGNLDTKALEKIIQLINGKVEFTFHRAIDEAVNPVAAFIELQNYGRSITNILSSGGCATAVEGMVNLRQMQNRKTSDGAKLLPGSGINPQNANDLVKHLGVKQLHIGTGVREGGVLCQSLFNELFEILQPS